MPPDAPTPQQQRLVFWVLWATFQFGIFVIYFFVGRPVDHQPMIDPAPWQLGLLPVLISGAIRWSLLPNVKKPVQALPVMVFGIALSEATCFLGIFVFPSHKFVFFLASVIGIFQFIPIYASRFFPPNSGE